MSGQTTASDSPNNSAFWNEVANTNQLSLGAAAHAYGAAGGLKVFPVWGIVEQDGRWRCRCPSAELCTESGKHPLVPWKLGASSDPAQIQQWWQRWPDANVGLALEGSGLLVLDLDLREGDDGSVVDGRDSLQSFCADHDLTAESGLQAITGGGGRHLLFAAPPGERIKNIVGWLPGVDIKAGGGYVLLAPSVHLSGRAYQWAAPGGPPAGPGGVSEALAAALRAAGPGSAGKGPGTAGSGGGAGGYDYAQAKIEGPPVGHRDQFFNAYAFELRKNGLELSVALGRMRGLWERTEGKDSYPWPTVEGKARRLWPTDEGGTGTDVVEVDEDKVAGENVIHLKDWARSQANAGVSFDEVVGQLALEAPTTDGLPDSGVRWSLQDRVLSEIGAALVFVKINRPWHRLTPGVGWFAWRSDSRYWEPDTDGACVRSDGFDRLLGWYVAEGSKVAVGRGEDAVKAFERFVSKLETAAGQSAVLRLAEVRREIRVAGMDEWNPDPFLLQVGNGVLDLRTAQLRAGDPDDRITMRAGEVDWKGPDEPCPQWEKQIAWMTSRADGSLDEHEAWKLQVWVGYSLTGSVAENKALMMYGKGRNGKSVFTETIARLLGTYATQADANVFVGEDKGHQTEIVALRGKRFAYGSELPETRLNVGRFLKLTGEASLSAREIYGRAELPFRNTIKFWTHGHKLPQVPANTARSDGYWRRIAPLMCERQVSEAEKDPGLKEVWWAERSGILAWAVRGCLAWLQDGLPETFRGLQVLADYQNDANPATVFAESVFEAVEDWDGTTHEGCGIWVPNSVLEAWWREWCMDHGEKASSAAELGRNLRALGFGRDTDKSPRKVVIGGGGMGKVKTSRGLSCPPLQDPEMKGWYTA